MAPSASCAAPTAPSSAATGRGRRSRTRRSARTRASRSCTAMLLRCSPAPQGPRSPKAPPRNPSAPCREREDPGMGAARKYAVIDPDTGKLDRRIFSEQAIYEEEMEKIFGRAWLMIGHDSLVPAVDDFFQTYMGEDPVILTRDGQGRLHALLNMCRHRGNRVCRVDDGNAKRFTCTYHGWTYRNDGAIEHVPGESEAYYGALDKPSLGLIEARVETYAGIVFATWAKDAPSLEAYLGDARWYLDTVFNRRDGGMQALGPMKWLEPVNWKTMVDNCSDNYHVPTSHLSSARVQTRFLGRPVPAPSARPPASAPGDPVGEPQQARLCQRALDHLPRRGRQRPPLRAR